MYEPFDIIVIIAAILFIITVRALIRDNAKPIFSVYQRPSNFYWPKVLFMYSILKLRQVRITNYKNQ